MVFWKVDWSCRKWKMYHVQHLPLENALKDNFKLKELSESNILILKHTFSFCSIRSGCKDAGNIFDK
jgi:hypothetical protein